MPASAEAPPAAPVPLRLGWAELWLLLVVPASVLWLGRYQFFPPPGWVDPIMYLGYALNFPQALQRFGPDYFAMRLPWTLGNFALHRLLAPNMAHLAVVVGFHFLAILSAWLVLRPWCGRAAAVAGAWMLALNPQWIAGIARGYVDGPAMALALAGFACLVNRGRLLSPRLDLVLAGGFWSLAVFTHPMLVLFTSLGLLAWLAATRPGWAGLRPLVLWSATGFLGVALGLAAAGHHLGAPWAFFLAAVAPVQQALGGSGTSFSRPLADWLPGAYRMLPPFALLALGLAALPGRSAAGRGAVLLALAVLAGSIGILELWTVATGGVPFQVAHYAGYVLPGQALLVGMLAERVLAAETTPWRRGALVLAGMLLAALLPTLLVVPVWRWEAAWRLGFWLVPGGLFLVAAGLLLQGRFRQVALPLLMAATVLAGVATHETRRLFQRGGNPPYKPYYEATIRLNGLIAGAGLDGRPLFVWYDRASYTSGDAQRDAWLTFRHFYDGVPLPLNFLDSLTSLWLWDRTNLNFTMPRLDPSDSTRLAAAGPAASVLVLCQQAADCDRAVAALAAAGFAPLLRLQAPLVVAQAVDLRVVVVDITPPR